MSSRKRTLGKIVNRTKRVRKNLTISVNRSKEYQLRTLRKLLHKAQNTQFGRQQNFASILDSDNLYEAYKTNVAAGDYLTMLPWWEKSREGKRDVTWPGKIDHFALSSGTSDGASKYIPVSREMVKSIRRGSMRQIVAIAKTDIPKDHLAKHWLMIGGSTMLNYNGVYYSGDLSGITTSKIPVIFQRVSKPEPEIKASSNWEEKINRITLEAKNWDVGMVAGVPAWIQLLFQNIIEHYNLNNIHDLWPNLEVYIHGGVSIKPYKKSIDQLLGRPIRYFETYLASEGFIAYQNRQNDTGGMKLLLRNGIFYEFIPFNSDNFDEKNQLLPAAKAIPVWEAEEGVEYALLLSTCSGTWRYLIGDTIKFTDVKRKEIIITGRTKHFISLVGEHLSVDNMTEAVSRLANELNEEFNEFCLAGFRHGEMFGHQWYIGTTHQNWIGEDVSNKLDSYISELNDDYAVERKHALKGISVKMIPVDWFWEWMKLNGKEGSQHKFPRVLKGDVLHNWLDFLEKKGVDRIEVV
ncbi:MAG: GH3 auxin-responsive promoter family protein [Flavobacteriales bacterium]|nr:GH3 auxin-responsive promoter family protein [Flavobacteriales bacterium]